MRSIDADKLFLDRPEFRNPIHKKNGEFNKGWNACVDTFCDIINEQPTINEWIPVSERLPKGEYDNYIVYTNDDRVCEYDIGSWGNGDWSGCNADGFVPHINVIAWMPFPEYKGENSD